jgi:hypothetical protein
MNTMLRSRWRKSINPLLTLHARSIGLANVPCTRRQVQSVRGDKVLALRRHPVGALAWRNVHDVHRVNLLETTAAGLTEEEVDDNGAEQVACGEDVAVAVIDCSGDEGREERDEEVLQDVSTFPIV